MDKEVLLKKLGANIREIRKQKSMTQQQLAHTIGKDKQSIQRLETGGVNPSFYYLMEIATGLEVKFTDLFKGL